MTGGGRTIKRRHLDPPQPVWVALWGSAATPVVEYPGLLHEWEGRGPAGMLVWRARVSLVVDGDPPAAWNEKHPWMTEDKVRPREV